MKKVLKNIKKSRIFSLICILLFIGICMGAGSLIAYIQHEANPTDMAVTYFKAFVQQNYDKMYECLYQEQGYYIDKSMYIEEIKKLRESYTIDSYEIKEPETKEGRESVTVKCKNDTTKETKDFVVNIQSTREGVQIIPDYFVDVRDMMAESVDIIVPKPDNLEFNGIIIDEKNAEITEQQENYTYHLKGMLAGKYNISATNDIYARNKTLNISGKDIKVDLTKEKLTANDKYKKLITDHGKKIINQFYKATRNRQGKNKTLLNMFSTKKLKGKVSKYVQDSEDIIFWPEKRNADSFKVIDMKISNLKTSISYSTKEKHYVLVCTYLYKYVSSTDTSLTSSYVDRISGTCTSKLTLVYKGDGDKVTVENIKMTNKNKKN